MKNETFREVAFWGTIVSAVLGLINVIICFVNGVKILDTKLKGDISQLFEYPMEICFHTILYKISIVVLLVAFVMMLISFLINTDGILKILMIICKVIQLVCIAGGLIGYFVLKSLSFIYLSMIAFSIIELIVLILYIIDSDHRKTILRVLLFSLLTAGSGVVFMLIAGILAFIIILFVARFVGSLFCESEPKNTIYDVNGKILGWMKRE